MFLANKTNIYFLKRIWYGEEQRVRVFVLLNWDNKLNVRKIITIITFFFIFHM